MTSANQILSQIRMIKSQIFT